MFTHYFALCQLCGFLVFACACKTIIANLLIKSPVIVGDFIGRLGNNDNWPKGVLEHFLSVLGIDPTGNWNNWKFSLARSLARSLACSCMYCVRARSRARAHACMRLRACMSVHARACVCACVRVCVCACVSILKLHNYTKSYNAIVGVPKRHTKYHQLNLNLSL